MTLNSRVIVIVTLLFSHFNLVLFFLSKASSKTVHQQTTCCGLDQIKEKKNNYQRYDGLSWGQGGSTPGSEGAEPQPASERAHPDTSRCLGAQRRRWHGLCREAPNQGKTLSSRQKILNINIFN